jgi:hypothetical protein
MPDSGHFVILSAAKNLIFSYSYEMLRLVRSLRMTGWETFAGASTWYQWSGVRSKRGG